MSTDLAAELRQFHQFLDEKLKNGPVDWSPEEAADEWRRLHPEQTAADDETRAIEEALADLAGGDRGVPFEKFDQEFRKQHGISAQP